MDSKWQRNHPWIFLFQNLFDRTTLHCHGLNKAVSLSLKRQRPGSVADAFQVCCPNGYWFASDLSDLCFCSRL